VAEFARNAIVIVVTNPLDAMCHVAYETTGFPRGRVIGMGGILDSSRFATFIGMELGVSVENISACVLGGHGDTMVPLPRYTTVAGIPLTEILDEDQIGALVDRARKGGAEIVNLLKTGSAYFAPACAVIEMVDAIIRDKKKIMPCSAYCRESTAYRPVRGRPGQAWRGGHRGYHGDNLTPDEQEALRISRNP
jgi:malate dehydrogenase